MSDKPVASVSNITVVQVEPKVRRVSFTIALDRGLNGFERTDMSVELDNVYSVKKAIKEKAVWKIHQQTGIYYGENELVLPPEN